MKAEDRERLGKSLRRIEGQVGGIWKMVNADEDCQKVLVQIMAASSALKTVGRDLLADEARFCNNSETARQKYAKLLKRFF